MEYYDTEISAVDGSYKMKVKLAKVEREELLNVVNPGYKEVKRKYNLLLKTLLSTILIRKRSYPYI